jgi:phytoene dehydrogenase-like protein
MITTTDTRTLVASALYVREALHDNVQITVLERSDILGGRVADTMMDGVR